MSRESYFPDLAKLKNWQPAPRISSIYAIALKANRKHSGEYCQDSSLVFAGSKLGTIKRALILLPITVLSETLKAYCFVW
jgi:hypothetical protein